MDLYFASPKNPCTDYLSRVNKHPSPPVILCTIMHNICHIIKLLSQRTYIVSNCSLCLLHNRIWYPEEYTGCYTSHCSAVVANYCVLGTPTINMKLQFCYITLLNSNRYCISAVQKPAPVEKVQFTCTETPFKCIFTSADNLSLDI